MQMLVGLDGESATVHLVYGPGLMGRTLNFNSTQPSQPPKSGVMGDTEASLASHSEHGADLSASLFSRPELPMTRLMITRGQGSWVC